MDQQRERIQADLRGLLEGDVRCDDPLLQLHATDASIYEIRPLAVVRPRGAADVAACVQYAAERQIPVFPRGAGTGLAGESLGPGIMIDFAHAMRRVVLVEGDRARVQPGVVLAQLNRHLARSGRLFGPDPSTRAITTLGSVLALDASGSHWPLHGSARGWVESLQVVLADGRIVEVGREPVEPAARDDNPPAPGEGPRGEAARAAGGETNGRLEGLTRRVAELLNRHRELLAAHRPRTAARSAGYHLHDVLGEGHLDLHRLLVGSEGTLALITEATVRTAPMPKQRGVALLFFDRLENAAQAGAEMPAHGASACDLMDRRTLTLARESDSRFERLIPPGAEAMLLIEHQGEEPWAVRQALREAIEHARKRRRLPFEPQVTLQREERDLYWRLTRRVVPILHRLPGHARPTPFVEDILLPPASLADFIAKAQNILKAREVTASLFAHAGHGQLHLRPFLDLADPADVKKMSALADELYDEVLRFGGSIGGEHGSGLSRTWFLRRQFGPLHDLHREVKRVFDPANILNPGKIVSDAPQPLTKNLRSGPVRGAASAASAAAADSAADNAAEPAATPLVALQLNWADKPVEDAAASCNGCGRCRTLAPDERMCPMFRLAPAEEATPRSKANLLRAVLAGRLPPAELETDVCKAIADLCVHCHQCRFECPARVDIPKLAVELKAQHVAANGLAPGDWFLHRLDRAAAWGSLARPLTNWALGNRWARWLLERATGVAQGRKLPRVASRSFLRIAARRRWTRPPKHGGRKALLFVDLYANWFDPSLAEALATILEHNGVAVYVDPRQQPAGMPLIAAGAVDKARRLARDNTRVLADAVRQGYHVVTPEPTTALCLSHEYPNLLDDDDARLVAAHTSDACDYLWKLHGAGQLRLDFAPVNAVVGYHLPCHQRALQLGRSSASEGKPHATSAPNPGALLVGEAPGEQLLRLIPGLNTRRIEKGCSGMAGTFGLKRQNYRASLRMGWGLISALRDPGLTAGATECSACKLQMEQGAAKPTLHPLKLLALAYGLAPKFQSLLSARSEELFVT